MVRSLLICAAACAVGARSARATVFASQYVPSLTDGLVSPWDNPQAALGAPSGMTGVGTPYPTILSPFNPAYEPSDIVEIGPGGELTLQFPNYIQVGGGSEVGVVSNNFLIDAGGGNNTNPAQVNGSNTLGGGSANVLVSDDGVTWHSIGTQTFDMPANYWQDATNVYQSTPGSVPADFGIPFDHSLSDFNGLTGAQTIALFGASGGGTWLNLGASGLSQIDYIRFEVPAGGDLVIDSVSANDSDVGAAVPEPTAVAALCLPGLPLMRRRRA